MYSSLLYEMLGKMSINLDCYDDIHMRMHKNKFSYLSLLIILIACLCPIISI